MRKERKGRKGIGKKIANPLAVAALGLFCGALFAAEPGVMKQEFNGTPFISGGVGEEELEQINAAKGEYNVRLLLAEKSGAYVTGVQLAIFDGKGKKVLDAWDAGPYLLTRLPTGTYQVSAAYDGQTQQKRLDVRAGMPQASMVFHW
ncbi:carboxypeptidase-like regulatory domain-containing protein [Propionivibrio limicola]|uniref:carboxypeptidase-like regulatory domain-containing protein n=1 Tax=Propionivibrio limicola TaxID=167645 RepID=UPI001291276C|nr:carboxypeptidase-like regulatory domain-containing protein [Propionivibrio limicola]